jgi:CBS domain-containing protein
MKHALVKDYMNPYVLTIPPDATLPEARMIMRKNSIRRLPVLQDGDLVGIVTLSDILEAEPSDAISLSVWERKELLGKLEVQKIMSLHPTTITADASLREAAQCMLEKKFGALPVVNEQGALIGILTESDIFRMLVNNWPEYWWPDNPK